MTPRQALAIEMLVGILLIIGGVACYSIPAALIVAGLLIFCGAWAGALHLGGQQQRDSR